MKKLIRISAAFLLFASVCFNLTAKDNKEYVKQEINASDRCLPTFYESIKNRWTFSMGYKDGVDPAQWKKDGLAKARELMIQEEDNTPFDMVVLETEKRDGYTAQKIVFNISRDSRVLAYLLVPKGKKNAKFPAALMLHDHGSNFVIGKEKMVKAFGKEPEVAERLKRSESWCDSYFGKDSKGNGIYPGDELAKRGYVVLSFDALGWGDRSVKGFSTGSQQSLIGLVWR